MHYCLIAATRVNKKVNGVRSGGIGKNKGGSACRRKITDSCRKNKSISHYGKLLLRQKVGNYCKILLTAHDKKGNSDY